jgi:predicted AlkP superfamily pyrophosphatase or phosphodiesterase
MKKLLLILILIPLGCIALAQGKPKMIVGIVVDQMKQEYLWRFYDDMGEDGFKRLVEGGFMAKNAHYNYAATSTGPGHASIYTGATPSIHGIVNNNWYSRVWGRWVYCAEDTTVSNVGGTERAGKISPSNLYSSTITDELKLFTQKQAKVIAMSIKDRGSALPGGHLSDGSYWFDSRTGQFMTSTYYMETLPQWVSDFNLQKLPSKYLSGVWDLLKDIEVYNESGPDDSPYEVGFRGKETPTFPYQLDSLSLQNGGFGMLSSTPWGNTILTDLAIEAIDAEELGQDDVTDFLAISFSSTDYIGHNFGPQSKEIQDTYLRLDLELARLFKKLDETVGKDQYVVFLSADHAVAENSLRMKEDGFKANNLVSRELATHIDNVFVQTYGVADWFTVVGGTDLFLNYELIKEKNMDIYEMQLLAAKAAMTFDGVHLAMTGTDLLRYSHTEKMRRLIQNSYHPKESGDVKLIYQPAWQSGRAKGTGHGNAWNYDTHVPIIFYGWGINPGTTTREVHITDIAPTISMLMEMRLPNGSNGQPVHEALKQ